MSKSGSASPSEAAHVPSAIKDLVGAYRGALDVMSFRAVCRALGPFLGSSSLLSTSRSNSSGNFSSTASHSSTLGGMGGISDDDEEALLATAYRRRLSTDFLSQLGLGDTTTSATTRLNDSTLNPKTNQAAAFSRKLRRLEQRLATRMLTELISLLPPQSEVPELPAFDGDAIYHEFCTLYPVSTFLTRNEENPEWKGIFSNHETRSRHLAGLLTFRISSFRCFFIVKLVLQFAFEKLAKGRFGILACGLVSVDAIMDILVSPDAQYGVQTLRSYHAAMRKAMLDAGAAARCYQERASLLALQREKGAEPSAIEETEKTLEKFRQQFIGRLEAAAANYPWLPIVTKHFPSVRHPSMFRDGQFTGFEPKSAIVEGMTEMAHALLEADELMCEEILQRVDALAKCLALLEQPATKPNHESPSRYRFRLDPPPPEPPVGPKTDEQIHVELLQRSPLCRSCRRTLAIQLVRVSSTSGHSQLLRTQTLSDPAEGFVDRYFETWITGECDALLGVGDGQVGIVERYAKEDPSSLSHAKSAEMTTFWRRVLSAVYGEGVERVDHDVHDGEGELDHLSMTGSCEDHAESEIKMKTLLMQFWLMSWHAVNDASIRLTALQSQLQNAAELEWRLRYVLSSFTAVLHTTHLEAEKWIAGGKLPATEDAYAIAISFPTLDNVVQWENDKAYFVNLITGFSECVAHCGVPHLFAAKLVLPSLGGQKSPSKSPRRHISLVALPVSFLRELRRGEDYTSSISAPNGLKPKNDTDPEPGTTAVDISTLPLSEAMKLLSQGTQTLLQEAGPFLSAERLAQLRDEITSQGGSKAKR